MATHLVIGDPHCTPKASNDRFLWAGKFAQRSETKYHNMHGRLC